EHLGEQDGSLVLRVEGPADDDPLAELGVLTSAGRNAGLLRAVAQGRDHRAADDRDHLPDMRYSRERLQPIRGQGDVLLDGIGLSGSLCKDLADSLAAIR